MNSFPGDQASPTAELRSPPSWVRLLLAGILVSAGILVLGDVAIPSLTSAPVIGAISVAVGAFEIVHSFWTRKWEGFLWRAFLGLLYVVIGVVLANDPALGATRLTYLLGLLFVLSGMVRIYLSFSHWQDAGWVMLASGVFGILAGLAVLSGFPRTTLWLLGVLLGFDLIVHGAAWFAYVLAPSARTTR